MRLFIGPYCSLYLIKSILQYTVAAGLTDTNSREDAFAAAVGRRLAKGPRLGQEISEDVPADASNE